MIEGLGGLSAPVEFHRRLMSTSSPHTHTADAGELNMLRGVIVSAFAHVDLLAKKVAMRACLIDAYAFSKNPPTHTSECIEYLSEVARRGGPLKPYSGLLLAVVGRLEALNEYRTLVAHAATTGPMRGTVSFPDMKKVKHEKAMVSRHNSTTIADVRMKAIQYALFSRTCDRLYYKLGENSLLPDRPFQGGWHSNLSPARHDRIIEWRYLPD